MTIRAAYPEAAASAVTLLRDPAVAAAWDQPSALAKLSVSGLAGHLARQVLSVPEVLAAGPAQEPISLLEHYTGSAWVKEDVDSESNTGIRVQGERLAAPGPAALAAQVESVLDTIRAAIPAEPADRIVRIPWMSWSLSMDDFLVTRMMEIAVHSDDLAASVGIPTPPLPAAVLDPVFELLTRVAVWRHGPTAVLRALSRSERAPATISAL
jgi:mycothiol maleylpyruvate isomerase-like protein